jgi:hypothetical protein
MLIDCLVSMQVQRVSWAPDGAGGGKIMLWQHCFLAIYLKGTRKHCETLSCRVKWSIITRAGMSNCQYIQIKVGKCENNSCERIVDLLRISSQKENSRIFGALI